MDEKTENRLEEIQKSVDDIVNDVARRGQEYLDSSQVQEVRARVEKLVRDYPMITLAGGMFLGIVLGKLFSSGRDD